MIDGRRFVINLVPAAQGLRQRVEERRARAQRDQRVHVGGAVAQRLPRRDVERRAGVEDHGHRQRELQPRRTMRHAEPQHRRGAARPRSRNAAGSRSSRHPAAPRSAERRSPSSSMAPIEIARLDAGRVVLHGRRVGREIDVRALDPRRVRPGSVRWCARRRRRSCRRRAGRPAPAPTVFMRALRSRGRGRRSSAPRA